MRASVNAAERLQPDARVRNVLGGWAPGSETREAVYANHLDAEVAREAGATRQHIRHGRRSARCRSRATGIDSDGGLGRAVASGAN